MKVEYNTTSGETRLTEDGYKSGSSKTKKIIIGVVVVLILAAVIGVIVYFTAFHDKVSGT